MHGHSYAVRHVRYSPHSGSILLSVSYDRAVCIWDLARAGTGGVGDPLVRRVPLHSEFSVGCDFNIFREGEVASCGWDQLLHVWSL